MKILGTFTIIFFLLTTNLFAQFGADDMSNAVQWKVSTNKPIGDVAIGDELQITFNATIAKGHHVFSTKAPAKDANLPTILELDSKKGNNCELIGGLTDGMTPHKEYDSIFETDLLYFHDNASFVQKIKIRKEVPVLNAILKYQVCNEEGRCVLLTLPVTLPLR